MTRAQFVLVVLIAAACSKQGNGVLARLEQKEAQVEGMASANAPWTPAMVGDGFVLGSAVRTGAKSSAKLRVGKSGKLDVKANTVVYFTRTPGHSRDDVRVETGSVENASSWRSPRPSPGSTASAMPRRQANSRT